MALAERTLFELARLEGRDASGACAGAPSSSGSEGDEAPGERIDPEVDGVQEPELVFSRNGLSRSSGAGKTIVVDADEPSSSSVCR
jgi:hypothetical protein